jgi:uncharacterized membrane protein YedE/YeeE
VAESEKQRIDRELIELLNEVRVALPGVQVLFAFLLLLPFQQTFRETEGDVERAVYLVALLGALAASVLLIAPTTFHRIRFRDRDKLALLLYSNRLLLAASVCLGVSLGAVTYLVTEILYGVLIGVVAALGAGIFTLVFWYAIPLARKATRPAGGDADSEGDDPAER